MKRSLSVLLLPLLLAACGPNTPITPEPSTPKPQQGQPETGFTWVNEPLVLWQNQSLYDFTYWVNHDPLQLAGYWKQTYEGNGAFRNEQYSLAWGSWSQDNSVSLVFNGTTGRWVEMNMTFTATEGPVGTSGVKTVYVTDASGSRYYSLQKRDLSGQPIAQGIAEGFGDGRRLPDVIKHGDAKFSSGAEAYTWVMDQPVPRYALTLTHVVFSNDYRVHPLKTCADITSYCSSTAATLTDAIKQRAWILNGGGNVSVRLLDGGKAEVRYLGEDGAASPRTYQVGYTYLPASASAPERIVFEKLSSPDAALTAAVNRLMSVGNGQLAVYAYGGEAVRGTYTPVQQGVKSKTFQYNKQAINDILTKWDPEAPPVVN